MNKEVSTHVAFSDESNWKCGRYRSIGLITCKRNNAIILYKELKDILYESNVKDFKWQKIRDAKYRFAANKIINKIFEKINELDFRIDVLLWDVEDNRHDIRNRDDEKNLQIMYFHLIINVLSKRWSVLNTWKIIPDEHSCINWSDLQNYLNTKKINNSLTLKLLTNENFLNLFNNLNINEITEGDSEIQYLCQVADLFAGMACFIRQNYYKYIEWKDDNEYYELFESTSQSLSNSEKERFQVIQHFNKIIKNNKVNIQFEDTKGFKTLDPKEKVNFWWYDPQSESDKAPIKE